MSNEEATTRLGELLAARWVSLVSSSPSGRRARTLSVRTAAREAASLARSSIKSGGTTKPSADPSEAGHGTAMRADVAAEALALLAKDAALKTAPALADALRDGLEKISHDIAQFTASDVASLEALICTLDNEYVGICFDRLQVISDSEPKKMIEFETILEQLVADLRERDWTDDSLRRFIDQATLDGGGPSGALRGLREMLTVKRQPFHCYIAVELAGLKNVLPYQDDRFRKVDELPAAKVRPNIAGPFICVVIDAVDPLWAAREARSRVVAALGAATVFLRDPVGPRRTDVVVHIGDAILVVDTEQTLKREPHNERPGQLERIIRSVAAATRHGGADPLFDAIRHHQRALELEDLESRFMLLWSGLERLCAGNPDGKTIQAATRAAIPRVLAIGKLRREISSLADAIGEHLWGTDGAGTAHNDLAFTVPAGRKTLKHDVLLQHLLADEATSRTLSAHFYKDGVELTQWYCRLRRHLWGVDGSKPHRHIAEFIEESRQRTEWQVLRLYRARNWVAHGGDRPTWLGDLVAHAHYYLTNLIAIAVHRRETAPNRRPAEIFSERCGQYEAYMTLLKKNDPRAMRLSSLLRPTELVA